MKVSYKFPSNTYNSTPFIKLYSNGENEVVGQTKGYNKIGEWKWYYENGTLKEEGSFDEQSYQTGIWKTYFPNGVLRSEEKKDKGYSSDLVKYHTNGKVRLKKTDSGTYTEYYTTGEIYTVEKKILGVSTGVSYYNKSGKLLKTL
jgi:antitoxin component YwqK of YwqJK toxin-antitoxin module